MAIIATAGDSKSYTPAPEGTHQAVCVDVIDQGQKPIPSDLRCGDGHE